MVEAVTTVEPNVALPIFAVCVTYKLPVTDKSLSKAAVEPLVEPVVLNV